MKPSCRSVAMGIVSAALSLAWCGCSSAATTSPGAPAEPTPVVVIATDAGTAGEEASAADASAADAACGAGFHDCQGTCSDDTNIATCGDSCTPCRVGPWAEPRCDGKSCSFTCLSFHADCDKDPSNGCEALLTSDMANCGKCGGACNGLACVDGVCQGGTALPR